MWFIVHVQRLEVSTFEHMTIGLHSVRSLLGYLTADIERAPTRNADCADEEI